jgi:hypothetical protein
MADFKSESVADFIPESLADLLRNQHSSPTVAAAYSAHWRQRLAVSAPFVDREDWCRESSAEMR